MEFEIINSGANPPFSPMIDETKLVVIHNAGFFSNSSIALQDIMIYYKNHGRLPDIVDRSIQYAFYKSDTVSDLVPFYFDEKSFEIGELPYTENDDYQIAMNPVAITFQENIDPQYSDYKQLDFNSMKPFIKKYFTPSEGVNSWELYLTEGNNIDFENTCAVFYRGNDKNRETQCANYYDFISQATKIEKKNPGIRFLVMPDEAEFMNTFKDNFPNSFTFHELPAMKKKDSANFLELPMSERAEYGKKFFAAVLIMAKCKYLVTHSGNGGLWSVIYRGNAENVYQFLNGKWI